MKFLGLLLACVVFSASAAEPLPAPAQYSFNDLYRLTVGQPLLGSQPAAEAPIRVAMVAAAVAAEPRFSVRQFPAPQLWLLVLAGLALAGWVAHRRLSYL